MSITRSFAIGANSGTDDNSLTSATFNSTGFTHIAVGAKHEGAVATIDVTDNKGSGTMAKLTNRGNGVSDSWARFHWAKIGTPGAGHTVTMAVNGGGTRPFKTLAVWLINATSGEITVDAGTDVTATGNNSTPDAGSITTSAAAALFMIVAEYTGSVTYTPGSGWSEDYEPAGSPANWSYAQSRQEAAGGTFDPACTASTGQDWAACAVAFIEVAGGGPVFSNQIGRCTYVLP